MVQLKMLPRFPGLREYFGPKGKNVVLESTYGSPKIVNDGLTVAKEVELEDPVENIGVKLVRQAATKTNDLAGKGTTTSAVLTQGLIVEGVKWIHVNGVCYGWSFY